MDKNEGLKKAIIISISDYENELQRLDFCKNDGKEMYELLNSLGYKIADNHKLIGHIKYETMRDAIIDFFTDINTKAEHTLLLYYSGHGIPDVDGDVYLSSSEINPNVPFRRGFSFNELTKMIQRSVSTRIVTILDCCYSGSAKVSKGHEDDAAKLGTAAIDNKSNILQQGEGKCILAASLAYQEAYALRERDHSIFTFYLLEGLRGNENSVDPNGHVTADSLGKYIYKAIVDLPAKKRPKQTPIRKVEAGGDIILASYPKLAKVNSSPLGSISSFQEIKRIKKSLWNNPLILILIFGAVIVVGVVVALEVIPPAPSYITTSDFSGTSNQTPSTASSSNNVTANHTLSQNAT
jgi:hypothetical protein